MILLLGGTAETRNAAEALAAAGRRVLVSTATDIPLTIGRRDGIVRHIGRLDAAAMTELIRRENIRVLIDVTHPYATQVRATAAKVARAVGVPYLTYVRPSAFVDSKDMCLAGGHAAAAQAAVVRRQPTLLTIGSRHVAVYAQAGEQAGVPMVARVLPHADSIAACRAAGIPEERIVTGRGPFSVEENRQHIRRFGIGTLVAKDSGKAGGFHAKQDAARMEGCLLVVVARPDLPPATPCATLDELVAAALQLTDGGDKT